MVGRTLDDMFHKEDAEIGEPVLEVRGLRRGSVVKDVSFTLKRGEILGFAGLVGAGRTETARLIFGADRKDAGEILIDGKPATLTSPSDAVHAGLGLVPEDRGTQGLVLKLPVLENINMATMDRKSKAGWVDRNALLRTATDYVQKLTIRTPHLRQKAMFLSGGNQQKVVLAKWLASNPKVLLLDEPTRGIDVGAKAEIHALDEPARAGRHGHYHDLFRAAGDPGHERSHPGDARGPRRRHPRSERRNPGTDYFVGERTGVGRIAWCVFHFLVLEVALSMECLLITRGHRPIQARQSGWGTLEHEPRDTQHAPRTTLKGLIP